MNSSIVGVDIGTQTTVIAAVLRTLSPEGKVKTTLEVITNEVSNRATPTLVSFDKTTRYLGESAKEQVTKNYANTIGALTRLAGRTINDPDIEEERKYTKANLVDVDGQIGAEVEYLGRKEKFSAPQLIAMFLTKIKATIQRELQRPVRELVVSVPSWYTDAQRRCLLDAADIAGLQILRLLNETTAAGLQWGRECRHELTPDGKPARIALIDIGHSNFTCSICEFKTNDLKVLSTASDRHFGGRNFDKAIFDHLWKEFADKNDAKFKKNEKELTEPKAIAKNAHLRAKAELRLLSAAEKLKKTLSTIQTTSISEESLYMDLDFKATLTREEMEKLTAPLLQRVNPLIEQALSEAKLKATDIDAVELIGGCTRIPKLQTMIAESFERKVPDLRHRLNADEAISRGCAVSCAQLSSNASTAEWRIKDIINYPIEFAWEKAPDIPEEDLRMMVFKKGSTMPLTRMMTFYRSQPFDIEARYAEPDLLPGAKNPWIGHFSVKGVNPDKKPDFTICKVKTRVNPSGILDVETAYYVEMEEVEEPVPEAKTEKKEGEAMETDENATAPPKTRKQMKEVPKGDLPVSAGTNSLDQLRKNEYIEKEGQMIAEDKLFVETMDRKNALEEEILATERKIDEPYESNGYADFANDDEKAKIREKCEQLQDWLYDAGEDTTKSMYIAKFEELRALAGPVIQRFNDKRQEEEDARRKVAEEAAARKLAEREAEKARKLEETDAAKANGEKGDEEMQDAPQDS